MKSVAAPDPEDAKPARAESAAVEPPNVLCSGERAVSVGSIDGGAPPGRVRGWAEAALDGLWPPRAAAHFVGVAAATREEVRVAFLRAVSEREAGESLADVGDTQQGLALLRRAADTTRAALAPLDLGALSARGRRSVVRARAELAELADPGSLAPLVESLDYATHRRVLRRHHGALRALSWSGRQVGQVVRERLLGTLASVIFAVVAVVLVVRTQRAPKVIASAIYAAGYPATAAIDGDPDSEWLLPDNQVGWLDVHVRPQRLVRRIRLINALNAPFYDRGTGKFTVEMYRDGARVSVVEGAFDPNDPPGTQGARDVVIGRPVDRIRIIVGSFHHSGGGLAEVKVY